MAQGGSSLNRADIVMALGELVTELRARGDPGVVRGPGSLRKHRPK